MDRNGNGWQADIVIAGAGVAGLAVALQQGRRGRSVLIVDRAAAPRDKVCGEGIMPLGMQELAALGVDLKSVPGAPFQGLCYRSRRQSHELSFPTGSVGRGVRRTALIETLQQAALEQPSVRLVQDHIIAPVWEGERIAGVRGRGRIYRGRVVVAADGVNSSMARLSGVPLHQSGYRMGLRQHFRCSGMPRVAVGLFPPHDVYLTPVGEGTMLATTMTDRAGYEAIRSDYLGFLRTTPFGSLFQDGVADSDLLGWYHPLFMPRRYTWGGMLLAGDAGGGIDPCLGLGISMALVSARHASAAIDGLMDDPAAEAEHLKNYGRARRSLAGHYRLFDRVFRLLVASPLGSEALLWGMRHWPEVADTLLEIVAQKRRWRTISVMHFLLPLARGALSAIPGKFILGGPARSKRVTEKPSSAPAEGLKQRSTYD